MVVKESPVESVELIILESFPPQYRIKVVSTMSGSSCSQFNGYDISRPFVNNIQVKVTYLAPAGVVECTADVATWRRTYLWAATSTPKRNTPSPSTT